MVTCPLLPVDLAARLPFEAGASASGSDIWPVVAPGVTPGHLAGDTWWQYVPAEWRRKASSRGQQDYLFTPAVEELQEGHERYTLATALWWYRSLQGEPIVVRAAKVSWRAGDVGDRVAKASVFAVCCCARRPLFNTHQALRYIALFVHDVQPSAALPDAPSCCPSSTMLLV
jgi:hypothetical protein